MNVFSHLKPAYIFLKRAAFVSDIKCILLMVGCTSVFLKDYFNNSLKSSSRVIQKLL